MKKVSYILLITILSVGSLMSQVPFKFNYQAVARDAEGELLANQPIQIRFSILTNPIGGVLLYTETHTDITTNDYGSFNLIVGDLDMFDVLSTISWGDGNKYLKVEIDIENSGFFHNLGFTQLLSVPFAFHAQSADSTIEPGPAGNGISNVTMEDGILQMQFDDGSVFISPNLTGPAGQQGENGIGIANIVHASTGELLIELTNGEEIMTQSLFGSQGETGPAGNGIDSLVQNTNATLTFFFTNGTQFTTSPLSIAGGNFIAGNGISINGSQINSTWTKSENDIYHNTGGNVGIGFAAPSAALHLKMNSGQTSEGINLGLKLENPNNDRTWGQYVSSQGHLLFFSGLGDYLGNFNAYSGEHSTASDKNRKKNTEQIENILTDVLQLEVLKYNFKTEPDHYQKHFGLFAQEVEKIFPELVKQTEEGQYSMNYAGFGVIAIQAIQEQQIIIDQQAEKMEVLELRLQKLEALIE